MLQRRSIRSLSLGVTLAVGTLGASSAGPARAETPAPEATTEVATPVKVRTAVMGVQVVGYPAAVAEIFTENIAKGAERNPALAVLSQTEITSMLGLEAQKQLLGCSEGSCMTELAGALDARYLITGRVVKLGNTITLALTMIDVETTKTLRREQQELTDDGEIMKWLRYLGARVVGADPGKAVERAVGMHTFPRWTVEAFALGRGWLGSSFTLRLPVTVLDATDGSATTAEPAFDVKQAFTGGGGGRVRFALLEWLELGLDFSYSNQEISIADYPTDLVAVTQTEGNQLTELSNERVRQGCTLAILKSEPVPDTWAPNIQADKQDLGKRDAAKLAYQSESGDREVDDGYQAVDAIDLEHSSFYPTRDETGGLSSQKGICLTNGAQTEAALVVGLLGRPLPWLGVGLDLRLGVFSTSVWWRPDPIHINALHPGARLRLLFDYGAFFETLPDRLFLSTTIGASFLVGLDAVSQAQRVAGNELSYGAVRQMPEKEAGNPKLETRVTGADSSFEIGLGYTF